MAKGDFPPEPLSPAEVRSLLDACDTRSLTGKRNKALLVTLWRAGLRCDEALSLRPQDIDYQAGTVRVLHGKGNRSRTVGIDGQALDVVREWDKAMPVPGGRSPGEWVKDRPLFCSLHPRRGARLSNRYVRAEVARLGQKAGIGHRVHPHGLRHTMAVELLAEGWPVNVIQKQLGHTSLTTTSVYLDHLYPAEVIDRARARTWA